MTRIYIPRDSGALAVGADEVAAAFAAALADRPGIEIARNGSRGLYWLEPLVEVETPAGRFAYGPVTPQDVASLLEAALTNGAHPLALGPVAEIAWLKRQTRLTFARCGVTDPLSMADYRSHGGVAGLERALALGAEAIVEEVVQSGLRGRGGAGFPTGIKWRTVAQAVARQGVAPQKYIVCNADEGDSGTFADRMIMEGDPFVLIEGMVIAGIAVGATKGYVYIRSEYPHAIATMNAAVAIAKRERLLGPHVAGSSYAFELEIRAGAGAYVCGEETSLLESLEGKRGLVRAKPPLPAHVGLFGRPTVINNVLSLASVPIVLAQGAAHYRDFGMGRSRGTMPIQLAGNIRHGGLFETAFGVTLGELVDDIGGGTASGRPVRAVQVGGPLGAYFPRALFDTPFDYEAFAARDGLIGHGGVVVFDDTVDMAKQARFAMEFCAIESCGKCTPCRIGSTRGVETMDRIIRGEDRAGNLGVLEDLCHTMKFGSLCALGGFTPYPVMSALTHFPEDFGATTAPASCGMKEDAKMSFTSPLVSEIDFGTPRSKAEKAVTLTIDGRAVTVAEGTSIMRAAMEMGTQIPKLCATDMLDAFGSCRLCLVEIEGRAGTPASCTTPVAAGMVVRTQTERLKRLRKGVMELYISDHPLDCLTCAANGDCELQDMAGAVGLRDVRYGYNGDKHPNPGKDESNPYFTYDPSKCIVCSRCVRACEEVQGTFALTIAGRGFGSVVSPGMEEPFLASECVSCGACVQACPTATLTEKSVIEIGQPEHSVVTTCAYCGVGCAFKAEMRGEEVVRMVPWKDGKANRGHSCVKGRFAWGYAQHRERILKPMIRAKISDPWREVSWDEAIAHTASEFKRIQDKYGRRSVGGITSSRCTNEETFLVQKLIRGGFGNNNVDTCARVCHSPTGYGLSTAYGTSAGTQDFDSVEQTDVVILIGASPTDAHPVFASRMKKRLRQGAKLIVVDPRRIDLVRSPHIEAAYHLPLLPGTNVAVLTALAHVVVTEGLVNEAFVRERCDWDEFQDWAAFVSEPRNSPEAVAKVSGVPAEAIRGAARLYATGGNGAIYYGLGVTEHSQGSTTVMAIANLAMATGNLGRPGVGVNPLRGQNNVQGACDMGSFPHELSGYRHISGEATRTMFEALWGVHLDNEPGLRIPNMLDAAVDGTFKGLYVQGEDILQSDPDTKHVSAGLAAMECVVVQDLFLNETANYAHVFLPGSTFLEKDGTFTNAERRIQRVRKVMAPKSGMADWEITLAIAKAMGFAMHYDHPSQNMDEIARLTPTFTGVSYDKLEAMGSVQWPCNEKAPTGTPVMHIGGFVRGKGKFVVTEYVATDERTGPRFPLLLTTGRILSQYNVGAQTRRTANVVWHEEDRLEMHPHDAEQRGVRDGDWVKLASRSGETTLRALITERVAPGVVYTTFHHPVTQANVITTDYSDWATNCPEYKVTAVQITPSNGPTEWQERYEAQARMSRRIAHGESVEAAE